MDKGSIQGGEDLEGWKVFTTVNGEIPSPILYEPPDCSRAKSATLKIAAVCDWHDGPPSVGTPRINKNIQVPQCYRLSAKITRKIHYRTDWTRQDDPYSTKTTHHWEEDKRLTVFATFNHRPIEVTNLEDGTFEYRHMMTSHTVTSSSFSGQGNGTEHMPNTWDIKWKAAQSGRPTEVEPENDEPELFLIIDARTKKVVEAELPSFMAEIHWTGYRRCRRRIHPISSYLRDSYDEDCSRSIDDADTFYVGQGSCNKPTRGDRVQFIGDQREEVTEDEVSSTKEKVEWQVYRN